MDVTESLVENRGANIVRGVPCLLVRKEILSPRRSRRDAVATMPATGTEKSLRMSVQSTQSLLAGDGHDCRGSPDKRKDTSIYVMWLALGLEFLVPVCRRSFLYHGPYPIPGDKCSFLSWPNRLPCSLCPQIL